MSEQPPLKVAVEILQNAQSSWLEILHGMLVPFIALVTIYIAFQQYKLAKHRFRYESYERRLEVYKTLWRFLSEIAREGKTD